MHVFNPLDPNPAVAARGVFHQSGRSFPIFFPNVSKIEPSKRCLPHIGAQCIKSKLIKFKRNDFVLINRYMRRLDFEF